MDGLLLAIALTMFVFVPLGAACLGIAALISRGLRTRLRSRVRAAEGLIPGDVTVTGLVPAALHRRSTGQVVALSALGFVAIQIVVRMLGSAADKVTLVLCLAAVVITVVEVIFLGPPKHGRLVAFTSDGGAWVLSSSLGYHPREALARSAAADWPTRRGLGLPVEVMVANERLAVPRIGWRDQFPRQPVSSTPPSH